MPLVLNRCYRAVIRGENEEIGSRSQFQRLLDSVTLNYVDYSRLLSVFMSVSMSVSMLNFSTSMYTSTFMSTCVCVHVIFLFYVHFHFYVHVPVHVFVYAFSIIYTIISYNKNLLNRSYSNNVSLILPSRSDKVDSIHVKTLKPVLAPLVTVSLKISNKSCQHNKSQYWSF